MCHTAFRRNVAARCRVGGTVAPMRGSPPRQREEILVAMIVWQGPSQIGYSTHDDDGNVTGWVEPGTPVIVLAVLSSSNQKTGDMVQLHILRADMAPTDAARLGADGAICGDCTHRLQRTCYVVKFFEDGLWRDWQAGKSEPFRLRAFRYKAIRFGSYGDPAAVPLPVWQRIAAVALPGAWTGYTHQWATCAPDYATLCMASVETDAEQAAAAAAGYRVYRVYGQGEQRPAGTVRCPWSEDRPGGKQEIQCRDCLKCSGTGAGRRGHVSIMAHGNTGQRFTTAAVRQLLPLSVV